MSKYIPKVGERVLSGIGTECLVLYVGEEHVFARSDSEEFSSYFDYFRPMPIKADIEWEQLHRIVYELFGNKDGMVQEIQRAGFTIPKKVKRSDIENAITNGLHLDCYLATEKVCELLGDLIEE